MRLDMRTGFSYDIEVHGTTNKFLIQISMTGYQSEFWNLWKMEGMHSTCLVVSGLIRAKDNWCPLYWRNQDDTGGCIRSAKVIPQSRLPISVTLKRMLTLDGLAAALRTN